MASPMPPGFGGAEASSVTRLGSAGTVEVESCMRRHPPWGRTRQRRASRADPWRGEKNLRRAGRFARLHQAEFFGENRSAAGERRAVDASGLAHLLEDRANDVGLHQREDFYRGPVVHFAE